MGVFLWIIIIGFIAGVIARLLMPGPNTPKGFVVTTSSVWQGHCSLQPSVNFSASIAPARAQALSGRPSAL
jgi:hypothetical protein